MVILVNQNDQEIGFMEKIEAHQKGLLHRAFSIFIFNSQGKMLIHQRAKQKYHSPMLWTNACCSHPRPGETILQAAKRRLEEEMGFVTELIPTFSFIYKTNFDNNLIEHELDHVLLGTYNGAIHINTNEVNDYKFIDPQELLIDLKNNPQRYTVWFKIAVEKLIPRLNLQTVAV